MTKPWKVILTDSALADLDGILDTTHEEYGTVQLKRYSRQITDAIQELEESGTHSPLFKHRPDIGPGISTYPLSRKGKGSPHQFYLRIEKHEKEPAIIILRILHERMDPKAHL